MNLIKEIIKDEKYNLFLTILERIDSVGLTDNVALLYEFKNDEVCNVALISSKVDDNKVKKYISQQMDYSQMLDLVEKYNLKMYRKVQKIVEDDTK